MGTDTTVINGDKEFRIEISLEKGHSKEHYEAYAKKIAEMLRKEEEKEPGPIEEVNLVELTPRVIED